MKNPIIDGIQVNAAHFAAMTEADAVKAMLADGFVPGNTEEDKTKWAKEAYKICKKSVSEKK